MSIETWSPSPSIFQGGAYARPPGDGWSQTGTKRVQVYSAPKNGPRYVTVPIYIRSTAPAQAAPPPPPPTSQPIQDAQAAIQQAQSRQAEPYPDIKTILQEALGIQSKNSAELAAQQQTMLDEQATRYEAALQEQATLFGQQTTGYQQSLAEIMIQQGAIQKQIQEQAAAEKQALAQQMAAAQAAQQQQYSQQVASLNQLMAQQQSQYQSQLAQSNQQQAAIAAQAAESARQAQALQRAFVPNLEPTAAAPAIGDMRQSGDMSRRAATNTLSNLAILTGVGGSGPSAAVSTLAGLQIA